MNNSPTPRIFGRSLQIAALIFLPTAPSVSAHPVSGGEQRHGHRQGMKRSTAILAGVFTGLGVLLILAAGFCFFSNRKRRQNRAAGVIRPGGAAFGALNRSSFGSKGARLSQDSHAREEHVQWADVNNRDDANRGPQIPIPASAPAPEAGQREMAQTSENVTTTPSSTLAPPGIPAPAAVKP